MARAAKTPQSLADSRRGSLRSPASRQLDSQIRATPVQCRDSARVDESGAGQERMRLRLQRAEEGRAGRVALIAIGLNLATPVASRADLADHLTFLGDLHGTQEIVLPSLFVGLVLFATTVSLGHIGSRRRAQLRENALLTELTEARAKLDRAETFLAAESQITIAWGLQGDEPEIEGEASLVSDTPVLRRVLGFGSWLPPAQAQSLETAVLRLRERGEGFRLAVASLNGRHLEAEGRAVSGRAVMRIRDVSGDRLEVTRLRDAQRRTIGEIEALRALLDAIPCPAWARDGLSRLTWVNTAYVRAVEAQDARDAMLRGIELLESPAREASASLRSRNEIFRDRAAAVVAGWRRSLDIVEVPQDDRSVGIAFDVSELEAARIDLQNMMKAHARTLDQLSTAVAIFDRRKQLVFHNAAYRQLWSLDQAFLDQTPSESEILDRLRTRRMLLEQADFRAWKEAHLAGYQSPDTSEQVWYLPDGRTLRAVINPNPQSGVTYLFDDVTAHFHLESQFNAQTRVQSETLDTLKEGVAVFGTDGTTEAVRIAALARHRPRRLRSCWAVQAALSTAISPRLCAARSRPITRSWDDGPRGGRRAMRDERTGDRTPAYERRRRLAITRLPRRPRCLTARCC